MFREALRIYKNAYGEEHPIVATELTNLAELLRQGVGFRGTHIDAEDLAEFGCFRANIRRQSPSFVKRLQFTGKHTEKSIPTSPLPSTP